MFQDLPAQHEKHWSPLDTDKLHFWWGVFSIQTIGKWLGRTAASISEKARQLRLGAFARGTMSMRRFERMSGYSRSRIMASAELLGIRLPRIGVGMPRRPSARRAYGITEEQQEQLLQHFTEHPGYLYPNLPGAGKSTQGIWGIGRKPPQCIICGKNNKPHYAKGRCSGCYQVLMRERRVQRERSAACSDEQD